jgi:hypothetical protein
MNELNYFKINKIGANELIRHKFIEKYIDAKIIDPQPCISKNLLDLKEKVTPFEINQVIEIAIERQQEHMYSNNVQPVEKSMLVNLAEQLCFDPKKLVETYNSKNEDMEKENRSYSDRFEIYDSDLSNSDEDLNNHVNIQPMLGIIKENQLLEIPDEISIMQDTDESGSVYSSDNDDDTWKYSDSIDKELQLKDLSKLKNSISSIDQNVDNNQNDLKNNEEDVHIDDVIKGSNDDNSEFTCKINDENLYEEAKDEDLIPNYKLSINTNKVYTNNLESTVPSSPFCNNLNKTLKQFTAIKCTDKSNESAYWKAKDKKNNEIYSTPSNMAPQLVFKTISTPIIHADRNEMSSSTLHEKNNLKGGNCSSITRPRHCNCSSSHSSNDDYVEPVVDLGMVMVKRSGNNSYTTDESSNHISTPLSTTSMMSHDSGFPLLITLSDANHSGYTGSYCYNYIYCYIHS